MNATTTISWVYYCFGLNCLFVFYWLTSVELLCQGVSANQAVSRKKGIRKILESLTVGEFCVCVPWESFIVATVLMEWESPPAKIWIRDLRYFTRVLKNEQITKIGIDRDRERPSEGLIGIAVSFLASQTPFPDQHGHIPVLALTFSFLNAFGVKVSIPRGCCLWGVMIQIDFTLSFILWPFNLEIFRKEF